MREREKGGRERKGGERGRKVREREKGGRERERVCEKAGPRKKNERVRCHNFAVVQRSSGTINKPNTSKKTGDRPKKHFFTSIIYDCS